MSVSEECAALKEIFLADIGLPAGKFFSTLCLVFYRVVVFELLKLALAVCTVFCVCLVNEFFFQLLCINSKLEGALLGCWACLY